MTRRPTLSDVARVAGVSAKTVSNVLLARPNVSGHTRQVVQAAVAELGYQPNPAGQGLASGRAGRIAVVVPNLHQPYFAEMAEDLILSFEAAGATTTLRIAPDAAAEREAVLGLSANDADAVVLCPHFFPSSYLDSTAVLRRPVVQVGGPATEVLDCVLMGEYQGSAAITQHLVDIGRRRIAVVWNTASPRGGRYQGIVETLDQHGMQLDPALFAVGSDWDKRDSGHEATVGLLRSGATFDAVLCANDALAVGAMRALREAAVDVPGQVSVTGFDDTVESRFTSPPLTSVSPEQPAMVEAAVGMVLDRVGGYSGPPRHVMTGAHVVVRGSSSPTPTIAS